MDIEATDELVDAVEAVGGSIKVAAVRQEFAQSHVTITRCVLHIDHHQCGLCSDNLKGLAEGVDESGLAHNGCSLEMFVHFTPYCPTT